MSIKTTIARILGSIEAIRQLITERHSYYENRFQGQESNVITALAAQKELVAAAFAAQKELTSAAFAASEKAIVKAEQAQSEYNIRSNEFRGQLDDQAKTLMPRSETENMFKQHRELIDRIRDESRQAGESTSKEFRALIDGLRIEITNIQKNESGHLGGTKGKEDTWKYILTGIGLIWIILQAFAMFSKP